jgi:small GTP-binding protein
MEMTPQDTIIQKKICLLGDFAIGKTSLVRRFIYNLFDDRYLNTVGVNISRKDVLLPDHLMMRLIIWDLSSSDKFEKNRSHYLHATAGALLICDLTRPATIARLQSCYVKQLFDSNPNVFVIVVGNKIDLVKSDTGTIDQVHKLAAALNAPCQITSAKTGEGVEVAFNLLAKGLCKLNG